MDGLIVAFRYNSYRTVSYIFFVTLVTFFSGGMRSAHLPRISRVSIKYYECTICTNAATYLLCHSKLSFLLLALSLSKLSATTNTTI